MIITIICNTNTIIVTIITFNIVMITIITICASCRARLSCPCELPMQKTHKHIDASSEASRFQRDTPTHTGPFPPWYISLASIPLMA